jgi:hypothetical protein
MIVFSVMVVAVSGCALLGWRYLKWRYDPWFDPKFNERECRRMIKRTSNEMDWYKAKWRAD